MDAIAERLGERFLTWQPETRDQVRSLVTEIIELADDDALGLLRSRAVEQEVLDLLDAPAPR